MRRLNGYRFHVCCCIFLITVMAIAPFAVQTAHSDMVIAPSKLVINSYGNATVDNYRNGYDADTTVKALIPYPINSNCDVSISGPDFTLVLSSDDSVDSAVIDGFTARYCYIDSVLIIEFDRNDLIAGLMDSELSGAVNAEVCGTFIVICPDEDGENGIEETSISICRTSEIFISVPSSR